MTYTKNGVTYTIPMQLWFLPASTPRIFCPSRVLAPPSPSQVSGKVIHIRVQCLHVVGSKVAAAISFWVVHLNSIRSWFQNHHLYLPPLQISAFPVGQYQTGLPFKKKRPNHWDCYPKKLFSLYHLNDLFVHDTIHSFPWFLLSSIYHKLIWKII